MNVAGRKTLRHYERTEYATSSDFSRIFSTDTKRLYLLSLLLTADSLMAERCFVAALEDSAKANAVFKEWASSWARRTIMQNAIRMVRPRPLGSDGSGGAKPEGAVQILRDRPEIAAVIALPAFERFVFVISVLEGYSVQDCSLLLGCARRHVIAARTRALRSLGRSREANQESLKLGQTEPFERDSEIDGELKGFSVLAVPA